MKSSKARRFIRLVCYVLTKGLTQSTTCDWCNAFELDGTPLVTSILVASFGPCFESPRLLATRDPLSAVSQITFSEHPYVPGYPSKTNDQVQSRQPQIEKPLLSFLPVFRFWSNCAKPAFPAHSPSQDSINNKLPLI